MFYTKIKNKHQGISHAEWSEVLDMKEWQKKILIIVGSVMISVILYGIFTNNIDKTLWESQMILVIVKTIFAIFNMGVAVSLLR